MQNCDTEHRNSGWCRRSHCGPCATPDEASGAALAYVGEDASSAPPGEARREGFERDGSPETAKVKPPDRTLCTKHESKGCNHLIPKPIQHESTVQINVCMLLITSNIDSCVKSV